MAVVLAALAGPVAAQTRNPLDPSLPLTIHALVGCMAVIDFDPDRATCAAASTVSGPTSHVDGSGAAVAELSSGTLRVTATSQAFWFGTEAIRVGGLAAAQAYDTLTFAGALSGPVPVTMHMTVDGSFFTTDANPNTQGTDLFGTLVVVGSGGADIHIVQGNSGQVFQFTKSGTVTTNANPTTLIFDAADVRFDLAQTFFVSPGTSVTFIAKLLATSGLGLTAPSLVVKQGIVDFGHTAQLTLDVPDGLTWSSASGVFLTGVAAPVPEPGAAWLLLTALVPLAARIRSARRATG